MDEELCTITACQKREWNEREEKLTEVEYLFAIRIIRIRDVALNSAKDEDYIVEQECSEKNKKLAGLQDENCSRQSCTSWEEIEFMCQ